MAVIINARGTSVSQFQVGKQGPIIKNNGGVIELRNSTDTDFAQLKIPLSPTNDQNAASKQYVDSLATGLDVKESVRAATSSSTEIETDFTYNSAADDNSTATPLVWDGSETAPVFDSVTLNDGDRVLIRSASDQRGNGIFTFDSGSGFRRADDADNTPGNEVSGGMFTFIEEGTTQEGQGYVLVSPNGEAVLGTDSLSFSQFSRTGDFVGGDGIDITGNTISADINPSSELGIIGGQLDISGSGASSDNVLRFDGTRYVDGQVNLASSNAVTGILGIANGGTGADTVSEARANLVGSIRTITISTDEIELADNGNRIRLNGTSAQILDIPLNASVAFPTGTRIDVKWSGSGASATIRAASGVTLNGIDGGEADITARYDGVTIEKFGTDEWEIVGAHDGVV